MLTSTHCNSMLNERIRLVCRGLRPSSQLIQYQQPEHHLTEKQVYIPIGSMSLERVSQSMSGVVTHQQGHNQSLHHGVLHSIGTMFGRTEEQCWKPVTPPLTSYQRTVRSLQEPFSRVMSGVNRRFGLTNHRCYQGLLAARVSLLIRCYHPGYASIFLLCLHSLP